MFQNEQVLELPWCYLVKFEYFIALILHPTRIRVQLTVFEIG